LAAATVLVVLLAFCAATIFLGERGRTMRCKWNLRSLHTAIDSYAQDHRQVLPPAFVNVGKYQTTWDLEVFPYLGSGLKKKDNAELAQIVPRHFCCPSDRLQHLGVPRSYSMNGNNMEFWDWTSGPGSASGVGLGWDAPAVLRLLNEEALKQPESLPGVKRTDIPEPSATILLTELVAPDNVMGKPNMASVFGSAQQKRFLPDGGAQFHRGKFNYLMADGHVEWLTALQTGSLDGSGRIWTIKKED